MADPLLKTLLVHEARRIAEQAETGRRWSDLHGILRDHHTALSAERHPYGELGPRRSGHPAAHARSG
ncbi:hypothetical protein NKH18_18190 [Streptomyces sp. M10(2022)]